MIDILYNSPYNIRDTFYIVAKIIGARWKLFLPLILIEIAVIALVTILCIYIPFTIGQIINNVRGVDRDYYNDDYYRLLYEKDDTFDENDHPGGILIRSNDGDDSIRRLSSFIYYYQVFIYYMSRVGYFISIYRRFYEIGATIIHSVFAGATVRITAEMYIADPVSSSTTTTAPTPTLKETILTHGWKHKFKLIASLIIQFLVIYLGMALIIQLTTTLLGDIDPDGILLVFFFLVYGILQTVVKSYMICVVPSIIVEGYTIMDAFQRTWQRCKKRVFLIVFVFYFIIFIISALLNSIIFQSQPNMYISAFCVDILQLVVLHLFPM